MRRLLLILFVAISFSTFAQTPTYKYISGTNPDFSNLENAVFDLSEPGPRRGAVTFSDSVGNLWLFGGIGSDLNSVSGYYNDFWKYDRDLQIWTWSSGKMTVDRPIPTFNNSLSFNAFEEDRVVIDGQLTEFDDNFSLELWFKTTEEFLSPLMSLSPNDETENSNGWALRYDFGRLQFLYGNGTNYFQAIVAEDLALNDDEWHHVALVVEESKSPFSQPSVRLFVNGVLIAENSINLFQFNQNNDHSILIGSEQSGGGKFFFNGDIDEVRIWDDTRTEGEILSFYNVELKGNEEGLAAYYDFNQGIAGGLSNRETNLVNKKDDSPNGFLDLNYRNGSFTGEMTSTRFWRTDMGGVRILKNASNLLEDIDDTTSLVFAYDFAQGIPEGDNFDQSILNDGSVNDVFAELINFNLTGVGSNYADGKLPLVADGNYFYGGGGNGKIITDLNEDGFPDIIDGGAFNVAYLENNGDGTFADDVLFDVGDEVRSVAYGDWNGDNHIDIATASAGFQQNAPSKIRVFLGDGTGAMSSFYDIDTGEDGQPAGLNTADFNGDSNPDLIVSLVGFNIVRIYLGDGAGGFDNILDVPVEGLNQTGSPSPIVADFDGDMNLDFGVSNRVGNQRVFQAFLNDGSGIYENPISSPIVTDMNNLTITDFNQDNVVDLIFETRDFANNNFNAVTWAGNGDGSFGETVTTEIGYAIRSFNDIGINEDGVVDLIIANEYDNEFQATFSSAQINKDGTLEIIRRFPAQNTTTFAAGADFDKDGIKDVVVFSFGVSSVYLRENNSMFRKGSVQTIDFDGVNDLIVAPDFDPYNESFVFETWLKTTDNGPLFSFSPDDLDYNWGSTTGSFSFVIKDGKATVIIEGMNDLAPDNKNLLIDNEWHHLALNVGNFGGEELVTIYQDGLIVFQRHVDFDLFLATGNPSYNTKIGYATNAFETVLGITSQEEGSNWETGFDFFAGQDGRAYSVHWQDSLGNLMVFGGEGLGGLYNSLRKYDFETENWVIVKGNDEPFAAASYGELNIPDDANMPGVRRFSRVVEDSDGFIWMFGGIQTNDNINNEWLNDLWLYDPVSNQWTWKGGSEVVNAIPFYGTLGVASADNIPGARESHQMWLDDQNNIWIFGGYGFDSNGNEGYLNDLWKYDITNQEWTWVAGSNLINKPGVYNELGIFSPGNYPGARAGSLTWQDKDGLFWFFGGRGYDKFGSLVGYLNDHWSFNPENSQWVWHGGSNFANSTGVYNQKGLSSTEFIPGARIEGSTWVDPEDKLWMFGGFLNSSTGTGLYSDFWEYSKETNEWTWYNGKNSTTNLEDVGVYGGLGSGSKPHPGARHGSLTWTDSKGDFWMMGGSFFSSGNFGGFLNDLWKYDAANETWSYFGGSTKLVINEGEYGSLGVSSSTNEPKSRWHGASWVDKRDRLWFFGGIHRNQVTSSVAWINDLWVYDPASDVFTWMGGQPEIGGSGRYGTKGVPSAANIPGARSSSADWVDEEGNFWLFGGYENFEYNNDLWKFNPVSLEWTWVSGNSFQNTPGTYGQKGVPNIQNVIGSRRYSDAMIGKDGKVWLFGGQGIDGKARLGLLNDLWQYDPATNIWTWIHGTDSVGSSGSYGVKGVSSIDNMPPPRYGHANWIDDSGNLWIMGGLVDIVNDEGVLIARDQLNDLWKFDVRKREWTWVGGSKEAVEESINGSQGIFSDSNVISGRERAVPFESRDKSLWLFGGRQNNTNSFGDFWEIKFTPGESIVELTKEDVGQNEFTFGFEEPWANEYRIQVSDDEGFGNIVFNEASSDNQVTVSGLETGSMYYLRINAVNEIGESGFGEEIYRVLTLPATPEFLQEDLLISNISPVEATINWNNNSGIVGNYMIEVSRDSLFIDTTRVHPGYRQKLLDGQSTFEEVTNLNPGTKYFARLRAGNATGISGYSSVARFLTTPESPQGVELDSSNFRPNGVDVVWEAVEDILDYRMLVSTDETFENPDAIIPSYNLSIIREAFTRTTINGLDPGNQYFMRLFARNESGLSFPSETVEILTLPDPPIFPIEPENAFISSISQNSAQINWNAPQEIFDGYLLEVSEESTVSIPNLRLNGYNPKQIINGDTLEVINGLESGETYFARVRSYNNSGRSLYSNVIEFSTVPNAPSSFTVEAITQETATLRWDASKGADFYSLEYSESFEFEDSFVEQLSTRSKTLTGLEPGIKYFVRIQSQSNSGASGEFNDYDSLSFTTIPGTPTTINFIDYSQNGAVASWEPVSGAIGYEVDVSDDAFQTFISGFRDKLVDESQVSITGLSPGVSYEIRVRSIGVKNKKSPNKRGENPFFTVPATPIAREASKVTSNGFSINWDPSIGADNYIITVKANELPEFEFIDTVAVVRPIDLSGLTVGVEYNYSIQGLNQSGASPASEEISVIAQNTSQTLNISSIEFSNEFAPGTTSIPIIIRTTGGFADATVTLRYKGVTQSQWSELITLTGPNEQTFEFEVTEFMLDEIGLVFEVYATDGFVNIERKKNTINRVFSETQSEQLPELTFGKWQMISIPFVLDDDLVTSIFNELVSLEYKKKWRLMHYVNEDYQDAITGFTRIELGKGYWFYSKNTVDINVGAGKTNTEIPFNLTLVKGWNQIGNPFNGVLSWNTILRENSASAFVGDLNIYSTTDLQFERSDELEAFTGAFVWSDNDLTLELFPGTTPPEGRVASQAQEEVNLNEGDNWMIPLQLTINGKATEIAGFGMNESASLLKDSYDRMVPPRFQNYLEMFTTNKDFNYPYFTTDVVPIKDEHVWHFNLESNHANGLAELIWNDKLLSDKYIEVWLVDESSGQIAEMSKENKYAFNFSGKRSFSVHYSLDPNYQPLPARLVLGDAYPNPTFHSTNIPVLLPESSSTYGLELSIYDLQGKKIAIVAKGEYESGLHLFDWVPENDSDFAGGVYFYRLSFTDSTLGVLQKKLIIKQ